MLIIIPVLLSAVRRHILHEYEHEYEQLQSTHGA